MIWTDPLAEITRGVSPGNWVIRGATQRPGNPLRVTPPRSSLPLPETPGMLRRHPMNPVLLDHPRTDPGRILHYRDRQYAAELLAAAILHFDFFTELQRAGGLDTNGLCERLGIADRPADVLLTLCRANGFITTDASGVHQPTPTAAEHLVRGSPWYLGPYYSPLRDTPLVQSFVQVLRTGKPGHWMARPGGRDWHESMQSEDFAREFTGIMNARGLALGQALARALATELARRRRVLDVAGGSGIYAATLGAAHPHLELIVLEQPPVDALARRELERHGLGHRAWVVAGDMFRDPWPEADVILLSNVLHDWGLPEVRALITRAAEVLPADGLLVIHDAFIHDDKTGPLTTAEYSALLMHISQGKCYSAAEYGSVLATAGFEPAPPRPTLADRGYLVARRVCPPPGRHGAPDGSAPLFGSNQGP